MTRSGDGRGRWRRRAAALQADTYALYLAYRDPRTPWYAKAIAAMVVAYAVSPIDLIPDFIPVLGLLDDMVIVPVGIALSIKLMPPGVMQQCRERARVESESGVTGGRRVVVVVVVIWLLLLALVGLLIWRLVR